MDNTHNFPQLGPIIIGVINLEQAKEFYINVFGLTIESESPNYVSARGADGTHIEIEQDSEDRFPNWKEHNVGTYKNSEFKVNDIFSFFEIVKQYGGKIITEPIKRPWGSYGGEIADPEGNIFLITQKI